ncbi:MAG TPA: radical SAM protein [Polyangia bacterium]|jgi:MoaA/NifB/PqqE/SkfB family radical SAM enzyme
MDPFIDPDALDPAHPLTPRKLENYHRACAAYAARGEVVRALPSKLTLQTTERCNLACPHCQLRPTRKRLSMPWSVVERVEPQLFPDLIELHPTNLGEPFVWPRFRQLCQRLVEYGVLLDLTTNGTMLTPERVEWIAPVVREVKVSFDGATAPTFERWRRGACFSAVCENVRGLAERLARVRVRRPIVALQMTLMKSNFVELPRLVRLAARLGAQRVKAYHLFSFSAAMDTESLMPDLEPYERVLEAALAEGAAQRVDLQLAEPALDRSDPITQRLLACQLPWHEAWIDVDGAVLPCHSHGGEVAGSVGADAFEGAWNGPLYRHVRAGLAAGDARWRCGSCGMNLAKEAEHERVPYDPASFLHGAHVASAGHPAGIRWSGRMRPFDLDGRRSNAS